MILYCDVKVKKERKCASSDDDFITLGGTLIFCQEAITSEKQLKLCCLSVQGVFIQRVHFP